MAVRHSHKRFSGRVTERPRSFTHALWAAQVHKGDRRPGLLEDGIEARDQLLRETTFPDDGIVDVNFQLKTLI